MSANVQGSSARYQNLSGISVSSQATIYMKAHYRPDVIGSAQGVFAINDSATTSQNSGASDDAMQIQLSSGGFPVFRQGTAPTTRTMTAGDAFVAEEWKVLAGVAGPFDGTSRTVRLYNGSVSEDFTTTMSDYSGGPTTFITAGVGDGAFTVGDGRIAYVSLHLVADLAEADDLHAQLLTTAPADVDYVGLGLPAPILDLPFLTAAPAGFTAVSGASIDATENPTLSGGGPTTPPAEPLMMHVSE